MHIKGIPIESAHSVLDHIVKRYGEILNGNLVGIYLHGSLAMGCFTDKSDIDFLVLVNDSLELRTKRSLIEELVTLQDLPSKGIEMSVVLERYAREFQYPTPFELHYSEMYKEKYLNDRNFTCGNGLDKDLAAHMAVITHRGICLFGKPIKDAFVEIPKKYYVDSLLYDIENVRTEIVKDPVYYSLNLCRILYYLAENIISSKLEAGNWGLSALPKEFRDIVRLSVEVYSGHMQDTSWDHQPLFDFVEYMLKEINSLVDTVG